MRVNPKKGNTYYHKNIAVVYIGPQDISGFGFFYEKYNPVTFFGLRIKDLYPHKI